MRLRKSCGPSKAWVLRSNRNGITDKKRLIEEDNYFENQPFIFFEHFDTLSCYLSGG